MSDTYNRETTGPSSPMIFGIVSLGVIVVIGLLVWITELPGGEYVGVEAAPTEVPPGENITLGEDDMSPAALADRQMDGGNVTEFSGPAITPEDTNQFVTTVPATESDE
ncbi:hypothetical protein [Yoonia litorea]|uniref:Uncharacterized protein n=1 Tax=Yoonia litorea TaxID=1123755 RepID=A0A1I6MTK3_9RHOB|nr:hypothetical protein [Yoonia litorea]SFS18967.1 hypothetical protein SAMN05444714_2066 [Yoonia litorea]